MAPDQLILSQSSNHSLRVITEEMLEKVATKCFKHTFEQMSKLLGLGVWGASLNQRFNRSGMAFTNPKNESEKCYFCNFISKCQNIDSKIKQEVLEKASNKCEDDESWTLEDKNPFMTQKGTISNEISGQNTNLTPDTSTKQCVITNEMLEKVATKCDKHSYDQMGKFFGVLGPSLNRRVNRSNIEFTNTKNDSEKCFFCKLPSISKNTDSKITKEVIEKDETKCEDDKILSSTDSNSFKTTKEDLTEKCVITIEMLEKVSTKCEKHTYDEMGNVFGVLGPSLRKRVKRCDIKLTNKENDSEKCYFCSIGQSGTRQSTESKITKEMLEKVMTRCEKHTYDQMAKFFGVESNTLNQRVRRSDLVFTNIENDPGKCYFCQITDFSQFMDSPLPERKITDEMMEMIKTKV